MSMQHDELGDQKCPFKYRGHAAIRVLTAVIVLIFVFWCGFQFGEVRVLTRSYHWGSPMMLHSGWSTYRTLTQSAQPDSAPTAGTAAANTK